VEVGSSDRVVQISWTHGSRVQILSNSGYLFEMFCYFLLAKRRIKAIDIIIIIIIIIFPVIYTAAC